MRGEAYVIAMRAPALFVAVLLAFAANSRPALADTVDVVVQAGHQGRPASCAPNHVAACNLGTSSASPRGRELDWTPIVAEAAAAELRRAGLRVVRRPADYAAHDTARAAVFLHFDGAVPNCASGASVGFPPSTDINFVHRWESRYRSLFPYRFAGENITRNEAQYYGYRKVDAPGKAMLIEFGEMSCPAQARWMAPRLLRLGQELAAFLIAELK
ncbi:MAG: hypothetical protein NVS3B28_13100 [Candidatus Velthaea sp.]